MPQPLKLNVVNNYFSCFRDLHHQGPYLCLIVSMYASGCIESTGCTVRKQQVEFITQ